MERQVTTDAPDVSAQVPPQTWQKSDWEAGFGTQREANFSDHWPEGTKIAVTLTFDTQADVDAAVPGTTGRWNTGHINYADLTQRQYDTRRGVQRILDLLAGFGIKATFPVCGLTAEWYPSTIQTIAEHGHELAVHGYSHVLLHNLTEPEVRNEIETATRAVESAVGKTPAGWVSPVFSVTPYALGVVEELGYQWNSDFHNDDLPYIIENKGRQIVELPVGLNDWDLYLLNDTLGARMGGVPYASPSHVTDILKSQFDQLYLEAESEPRVFHYCMHPKISGRPYRARGLAEFIEYVSGFDGVWFCTCGELASLCMANPDQDAI